VNETISCLCPFFIFREFLEDKAAQLQYPILATCHCSYIGLFLIKLVDFVYGDGSPVAPVSPRVPLTPNMPGGPRGPVGPTKAGQVFIAGHAAGKHRILSLTHP